MARHGSLRTIFEVRGGAPAQLVKPTCVVPVQLREIGERPGTDQEARAYSIALRELRRPFDLRSGPLIRATLLRLGPEHHVFLGAIHHIVSDGWSAELFVSELAEHYGAYSAGKEPSLAPLPMQYSDFTLSQRDSVANGRIDEQLSFWRRTLSGAPTLHNLPLDRVRPMRPTLAGGSQLRRLDSELVEALQQFARAQRATFFMLMTAAFQVLIYKYSGHRDILIGIPVSGRNLVETEALIGLFVNTVVLRATLNEDQNFADVLNQVRENLLDAVSNQDAPFELIVGAVCAQRSPRQNPLFQIMFSTFRAAVRSRQFGAATAAPYAVETTAARFDLSVNLIDGADGVWWLQAEYSAEIFDHERIAWMLEAYIGLLRDILADGRQRLADLHAPRYPGKAAGETPSPTLSRIAREATVSPPAATRAASAADSTVGGNVLSIDARTRIGVGHVEATLIETWKRFLKTSMIDIDDNFFDLGGNSLLAISLVAEINRMFDKALPVSSLIRDATIRSMATRLVGRQVHTSSCVPLVESGSKPPLFAAGCALEYKDLSQALGPDQPFYQMDVYALQEERLIAGAPLFATVEAIALQFVEDIQAIQPRGPYFLAGQCEGGVVVREIARQLQRQGHEIATLMQFDTPVTGYFEKLPRRRRISWPLGQRHAWKKLYALGRNKFRKTFLRRTPGARDYIWSAIWEAVAAYATRENFDGEVILFRAEEQLWPAANVALGWDKLGAVKIYDVPGDHVNLFTIPATQTIIQRALADAQMKSLGLGRATQENRR